MDHAEATAMREDFFQNDIVDADIPRRVRETKPAFFTAPELRVRWGLKSSRTILRMVERGELKGVKIARRVRIPIAEVHRLETESVIEPK